MSKFKPYEIGKVKGWTLDVATILPEDHIAYKVEALVNKLDTTKIEANYSKLGSHGLHPKLLLSVIFLGYIQGIRSGRKLATACSEHIAYIYLSKSYCPKKTLLNDFRKANVSYFKDYFLQFLWMFDRSERDASTSIYDGSKIGANASKYQSRTKKTYSNWLGHLEEDIASIEEELKKLQAVQMLKEQKAQEQKAQEQAALKKELEQKKELSKKIETIISSAIDEDQKINLTDPDAPKMKGKKGNFDTFFNVQLGCNEQQIIVHAEVTTAGNDKQQLKSCIEGTKKNTGQKVKKAIADSGYASFDNYEYLKKNKIIGYIPDQDFNKDFKDKPYHKEHFKKHPTKDELICPQEHALKFHRIKKDGTNHSRVYKGIACQTCPVKEECTKADARTVAVEKREPLREEMRARLNTDDGKQMYKKRLHPIESIFGHLKFNLGYTYFLLRGLENVNAEFFLMCIGYNLRKLISFFRFFNAQHRHKSTQMLKMFFYPIFQRTNKLTLLKISI